jgi:hypothetical protein
MKHISEQKLELVENIFEPKKPRQAWAVHCLVRRWLKRFRAIALGFDRST